MRQVSGRTLVSPQVTRPKGARQEGQACVLCPLPQQLYCPGPILLLGLPDLGWQVEPTTSTELASGHQDAWLIPTPHH